MLLIHSTSNVCLKENKGSRFSTTHWPPAFLHSGTHIQFHLYDDDLKGHSFHWNFHYQVVSPDCIFLGGSGRWRTDVEFCLSITWPIMLFGFFLPPSVSYDLLIQMVSVVCLCYKLKTFFWSVINKNICVIIWEFKFLFPISLSQYF